MRIKAAALLPHLPRFGEILLIDFSLSFLTLLSFLPRSKAERWGSALGIVPVISVMLLTLLSFLPRLGEDSDEREK